MKLTLISSIAGLALLGAASAASATTTYTDNFGTISDSDSAPSYVYSNNIHGNAIADVEFTIAADDLVGTSLDFTLDTPSASFSSFSLYSGTPGSDTLISTAPVGINSIAATLTPGQYFAQAVMSDPTDTKATFSIGVIASPVSAAPEPSTWVLMIAGVAMTGGMLRYRRNAAPSLNLA